MTGTPENLDPARLAGLDVPQPLPDPLHTITRARSFVAPVIASETLDTGENSLAHADAVAAILRGIGASPTLQAAVYLVHVSTHLNRPQETIAKAFGDSFATLAVEANKLMRMQRQARVVGLRRAQLGDEAAQVERVRKMLLGFSRDLRVVLLRLASRLQTLRYYAASRRAAPAAMAHEALHVFAPLANRLGIWQIKWELEDLAFRFLEPDTYHSIARQLAQKRTERETWMEQIRTRLQNALREKGIQATVQGRPKHIYSIVRKMRGKSLQFDEVYDVHALRVIVAAQQDCYAALAWVHAHFTPVPDEFDNYIAKPKPNGYQSLHTVVRDTIGRAVEIQIRTQAMHEHAENGVAAHWAYKEAGTKGYTGVSASSDYDSKIALLRQLLAWGSDLAGQHLHGLFDDRIYVLTPQAAVIELPQGATPVDFAYSVHTSLGHRCRGARVDGVIVPLNTRLKNGQTVEISAAKEGHPHAHPSRDWLNPELGYLASPRARAKVRAWFNARAAHETMARGREAVEKRLQREGKTALKLEDLAARLGFASSEALFEVVGKDEYSLRNIETLLRPAPDLPNADTPSSPLPPLRKPRASTPGAVLVVGMDSLMTQLAKCCKPAPPDAIKGFVSRGKGVSVHRADCPNFRQMATRSAERVIEVAWGQPESARAKSSAPLDAAPLYPVDVVVQASDRQGLLRDILDVFARQKTNVIGVQTQSVKGVAWMICTVEVPDAARLNKVLPIVASVPGVRAARRQ